MASKVVSRWDAQAQSIIDGFLIDQEYRQTIKWMIIQAMNEAYVKGYNTGAESEHRYPHREDMGR